MSVLLKKHIGQNGLAACLLLTGLVVLSGFIGRYIYTAVPRTTHGIALEAHDIKRDLDAASADLARQLSGRAMTLPASPATLRSGTGAVLTRGLYRSLDRIRYRRWQRSLSPDEQPAAEEIASLLDRQRSLQMQLTNLAAARRLLALWHTIHVPIGLTLFIFAFFHAGAAIYYATLLK